MSTESAESPQSPEADTSAEVTGATRPADLVLPDVGAWRRWLDTHEDASDGVWLRLAKKGTTSPTSLTYAQALDEALCSGWIDGQKRSHDASTFVQRFTPRRRRSMWSRRNVGLVARLTEEGRMRARGVAEVVAAQADGRWERAYAGAATMEVPPDLTAALDASPAAAQAFATLDSQNRYAVLHRIVTAPDDTVRERRRARLVEMLARGDVPHPR
ncbi:YdeI/OmpD-associated family protein [Sanguibacter suaedae]|uniref:YdeI/OmpD-associated family protein n=1 Tax=Sanguibacter suaedae TaxID=2795737 RepID=A0A934I9J1_9MICO|nr:YdeI/OmpD-associated family protein [Sanguibacter suaedae]MBI9113858.1 YdeI/OmpD-associated family protein [Sanguibacter suaedae]